MLRRRLLTVLAPAAAAAALVPAAASAQELSASAELTPDRAGAPSGLAVSFTAKGGGRPPDSFQVTTPAGMKLDPRAVAVRCADDAGRRGDCPAASRVGSGEMRARTIIGTFTARGSAYMAVPRRGEHAAIWMALEGFSGAVRASVRRSGNAYVVRLDDIIGDRGASRIPEGAVREVSGSFRVEARRRTVTRTKTVRVKGKRRKRKVRTTYHLVRNPSTCPAEGWVGRVELTTGGARREVRVVAPCSPR